MTDGMLLREFLGEPDMESYRLVSYVSFTFNIWPLFNKDVFLRCPINLHIGCAIHFIKFSS